MRSDPVFWQVTRNTFVYTFFATVLKMVGGLGLALVMNQDFRFKNTVRALMLLPFIVPTVLSTIAWMWILDPAFAPVNWFLRHLHIADPGPSWLGNPNLAMMSLIIVNVWRGLPFYGITLLAGLQTISPELYEAATIDGASTWDRFVYVTLPLLKPVIFIVTMFSVIFTFADFQLVYVLTRGGPGQCDASVRDLCLRPRHGRRSAGPRRVGRAGDAAAAGADHHRDVAVYETQQIMMVERGGWRVRTHPAVAASRRLHDLHAVPVLLDGGDVAEAEQRAVQSQDHAADRLPSDAASIMSIC